MDLTDNRNMQQSTILKPQDIALLVMLLTKSSESWRQVDLGMDLGLSQGEIAKSLARLGKAGLVNGKSPNRSAALELLIHGVKYFFPAELGPLAVGMPTAISAPTHKNMVVDDGDIYVWPFPHGDQRGQSIVPLYPQMVIAAAKNPEFYDLMSAIEILRIGRAREREMAKRYLERKIKSK